MKIEVLESSSCNDDGEEYNGKTILFFFLKYMIGFEFGKRK